MPERGAAGQPSWLLLIHQLPPRPLYLRAQVRRRLAQVGAVPLKNSVYVLPDSPEGLEDLQWIAQEAAAAGGEACVCRATILSGVTTEALELRFRDDASARLAPLKGALADRLAALRRARAPAAGARQADLARLRRQVQDAARTDFFNSDIGQEVRALMTAIDQHQAKTSGRRRATVQPLGDLTGRVWVTRRDPHIDRLATAWLIRRFVDPAARFRFVDPVGAAIREGERTYDMVGAHFTHEGDRCTFETMVARLGLSDAGLRSMAEIVHDIDLKDAKFGRPDAAGVHQVVQGLIAAHADSAARIAAARPVFDALYASFGARGSKTRRAPAKSVARRRARR
jgi:hypothetical protein